MVKGSERGGDGNVTAARHLNFANRANVEAVYFVTCIHGSLIQSILKKNRLRCVQVKQQIAKA